MYKKENPISIKNARCFFNPNIVCIEPHLLKKINRHRKVRGLSPVGCPKCQRCEYNFGMDKFLSNQNECLDANENGEGI